MSKLEELAKIDGRDVMEILEEGTFDSVCQGICTNEGCDYNTEVESDCETGYCEICGTQTVQSALILAGMI